MPSFPFEAGYDPSISFHLNFWEYLLSMYFWRVFIYLFFFSGLHRRYMGVIRLGVKSELQLLAYTTATETPDLSHVCDSHHCNAGSFNPLREAGDRTCIPMDTSWVCYHQATMGTPLKGIFEVFRTSESLLSLPPRPRMDICFTVRFKNA